MRLQALAERSLEQGCLESARGAFLRASNYWRAAYTFLIGAPVDPRVRAAYHSQRSAFEAAVALMRPTAERIAIPYEGHRLHGYFFHGSDAPEPRPVLIINGGYDSTAEEGYFLSGAAAVARGFHCIVFDGPGQGAAVIEDGLVFRPDWEAVIRPVVDFALSRPEADPQRIALMGVSFGGYLAPRGASGEPRLAALIADPGEASLADEFNARLPPFLARGLADEARWARWLLRLILGGRLGHVTKGWGLRRGLWVHGLAEPLDYLRLIRAYSVKDEAAKIGCPSLICRAEDDEIGVTAKDLFERIVVSKAFHTFDSMHGAGTHCEAGARSLFNQYAFDWLHGVLGVRH